MGHIVYAHQSGSLLAVPFDPKRIVVTGTAIPVLNDVAVSAPFLGNYVLSRSGTLVYGSGTALTESDFRTDLFFVDAEGVGERLLLPPLGFMQADARLSPDGRRLAYTSHELIVFDLEIGSTDTLFSGELGAFSPRWSPDGTRIAYSGEDWEIYATPADGASEPV